MPTFHFRGRLIDGSLSLGTMEAEDRAQAIQKIEHLGCTPFEVESASGGSPRTAARQQDPTFSRTGRRGGDGSAEAYPTEPKAKPSGRPLPKLSSSNRLLFTEQLSYLLATGTNLDAALRILSTRLNQPALRKLCAVLHASILDGTSFSKALAEHPHIFSSLYINLVRAGEASGALSDILCRLAKHEAEMKHLRDRVQQALLYPAFLAVIGFALIVIFTTVMVPQLNELFRAAGGTLPLATRWLIKTNEIVTRYWWLGVGLGCAVFTTVRFVRKSPIGRLRFDHWLLTFPGIGMLIRYRFYAHFSRTLHTLLRNGVSLVTSMQLLEELSENRHARSVLKQARNDLYEGVALSRALGKENLLPGMFIDMVSVGEQTGRLPETMENIANVYERELDRRIKMITALIPPAIILVVAIVVGVVVFGILSAVFSVTSGLQMG